MLCLFFFFFKQKTAYEMRISDWSSDVCSSDLATIREMDRLEKAIYTAEDPVEYHSKFVTHVGINEAVGLDFARSIKAFMRSDPDVIILGEIDRKSVV